MEKEDRTLKYLAVLTTVVAIGVSLYLGSKVNEHNRLSVSPYLDITYAFGDEGLHSGIRFNNTGLGPAEIIGMKIEIVSGENGVQRFVDWEPLISLLELINQPGKFNTTTFKPGNSIRASSNNITLFGVAFNTRESIALEKPIENKSIDVFICYKSLSGEVKQSSLQGGVLKLKHCGL